MAQDHTKKKVILFNGPPGSGKDTCIPIAMNYLASKIPENSLIPYRPVHMKFADPLKAAAHALLGIPYSCEYYEKEFGNEWKNKEAVEFYGKTPRSEYIAISEEYAKKRHGEQVFGRVAARRIALQKQANVFLFSDSGFACEAVPIISLVGINNVVVVELTRPNCDFKGDSRGYIGEELQRMYANKLRTIRLPNDGDKEDLRLYVHGTLKKYFGV